MERDDSDLGRLLGDLERGKLHAPDAFRDGLVEQLGQRLALRRGEGDLPEDWALCPFDRFCVAEQPIPRILAANCPCLRGAPILRLLKARGAPIHARPCAGKRLRRGEGGDSGGPTARSPGRG